MINPFKILAAALRRTWDEYISVILISAVWLSSQILVIPGPPATAALFAMARHTYDGEYWNAGNVWHAFKELFWPAWKWAIPNIVVIGLAVFNLSTFWSLPGSQWALLRMAWLTGLVAWLGLNLYYWPFWLAADDKSLRNTYLNCGRFWMLHPAPAVVLFLICLAITTISLPFALPLVLGAIFLVAMIAETAVRRSLESRAA